MTGPTEKSRKTNLETINNIKSCRPVQYEQKRITQTQENGQEKRFLHILTASICEMRQKPSRLDILLGPVVKYNKNELQ